MVKYCTKHESRAMLHDCVNESIWAKPKLLTTATYTPDIEGKYAHNITNHKFCIIDSKNLNNHQNEIGISRSPNNSNMMTIILNQTFNILYHRKFLLDDKLIFISFINKLYYSPLDLLRIRK